MLITNQSKTYLINRMEAFETTITPVRRNVARKSTANRPLLNTIINDPLGNFKRNVISNVNIISRPNRITNYSSYKSPDFSLYFKDDFKNVSKTSLQNEETEKRDSPNDIELETLKHNVSSNTSFIESEEEDVDLSGIFCVSDAMDKYLKESNLSPSTNYDSSEESIDLSRVKNYPIKQEIKCKSELYCPVSPVFNEYISVLKESELGTGKNIKQESISEINVKPKVQPVIISEESLISDDYSTTDLGIQTKKCLFDPNLESVTCKVKVREEVLVCENVPLKMTILEANFDVDQLENKVEESIYNLESETEKDDLSIVPQVICAMSLENTENSGLEDLLNAQDVVKQKKGTKKPKKMSLKNSEIKTEPIIAINERRLTRSKMLVNNTNKRVTRNSTRLNPVPPTEKEDQDCEENFPDTELCNSNIKKDSTDELCTDSVKSQFVPLMEGEQNFDNPPDVTNIEKSECKKKCIIDKKGKKEINEGVLLHVEATKETQLMRDGKIIKDKEEYLKDIESKIDQNLPVVVEKEFDIQQSLTEEILLDQALRLAHQRTSPRLSKIMKEAILKASIQKQSLKSKHSKSSSNKIEIKSKVNRSSPSHKNKNEESEPTNSFLNYSTTSESASDLSSSLDLSPIDIEKKNGASENQQKRKKENYIVTPVIKESNVVESLTIKICRKTNKKKTGFRLASKNKKNNSKKECFIPKPLCSNAVNMDDLSKTFEDILQDDNWCSDDKLSNVNLDDLTDNEREENSSVDKECNNSDVISSRNLLSQSEIISPVIDNHSALSPTKINSVVQSDDCLREKYDNNKTEEITNNDTEQIKCKNNNESKDNSAIPFLGEIDFQTVNKSSSPKAALISSPSKVINDVTSEKIVGTNMNDKEKNHENLEYLSCQNSGFNNDLEKNVNPTTIDFSSPLQLNKPTLSPNHDTSQSLNHNQLKTSDPSTTKPPAVTLPDDFFQHHTSPNQLPLNNSLTLTTDTVSKPLFCTNIVEKQINKVVQQQINSTNHLHNQIINKGIHSHQEQTVDQPKGSVTATNTDIGPKVLPLSIASRDPRLRKSHVRVIVEVSTSSVSNSLSDKPDIEQESRIISHVMENFSKEVDNRRDDDSDPEMNENHSEMDRKKKFKKREVDAELLYKTPLSDLHDIPERSSYTRSFRKKSPPKKDKRDPWNIRRKEITCFSHPGRVPETYREYHEVNTVYSKICLHDPGRTDNVAPDEFSSDFRKIECYRSDPQHLDQYNSFQNEVSSSDVKRRESYVQKSSTEFIHEVRHTKEFSQRHQSYQNLSEHRRLGFQYKESEEECRHSENYPPDHMPPDSFVRGYKRPSDFSVVHSHHESPDFIEKEVGRERNHVTQNEPSYSRWDYAHKKVEGHFPPDKEKENPQPDEINMWEEERDLIDGPVKSFSRPYYRRKKFSRGEELFERRNVPWDVDNRRYNEEIDRNYERLWVRKTDQELIHGPERERWDRRGRKGFREERSRSPRRDHDRYTGKRSKSPGSYLRTRREESPSPHNSPLVLDSPMSPEPADRFCVLEPTKCLTVPQ